MYVPAFNAVEDESEARAMVAAANVGWLVTVGADGSPVATLLPVMWEGDTVIAHMAKANGQWREIESGARALVIVAGPDAYVSPTWYPSKEEHGRVVPTWNYTAVHLTGTARVHLDAPWLRNAVTELTDVHESGRRPRWSVSDAPDDFVDVQLRAIVGIEITVDRVDAKAKLSQNRSEADRLGVIDGLQDDPAPGAAAIAGAMQRQEPAGLERGPYDRRR